MGQSRDDQPGNFYGAFHFPFGKTRVRAYAVDGQFGTICRKSFVLHIAGAFAIHGITGKGTYLFYIGFIHTTANLFIGRKQDLYVPCFISG
jgi:hypothetical protein